MEKEQTQQHTCRVCGYLNKDPFYEGSAPLYEICPCCGSESGYHDATPESAESNRRIWIKWRTPWHAEEWVQRGMKVNQSDLKPKDWDLAEQLRRIGVELKDYQDAK